MKNAPYKPATSYFIETLKGFSSICSMIVVSSYCESVFSVSIFVSTFYLVRRLMSIFTIYIHRYIYTYTGTYIHIYMSAWPHLRNKIQFWIIHTRPVHSWKRAAKFKQYYHETVLANMRWACLLDCGYGREERPLPVYKIEPSGFWPKSRLPSTKLIKSNVTQ